MAFDTAQKDFLSIVRNLSESDKGHFFKWISDTWDIQEIIIGPNKEETSLREIAAELRRKVTKKGELTSEAFVMPSHLNKDEQNRTVIVDEFLFDDEYLNKLVADGKFSRHYCEDCGSRKVEALTLMSHSFSIERLSYIFTVLLPPLNDLCLLDVGSGLGSVLYGAYLLSKARRIIGVEISTDVCKIALDMLTKKEMLDRVELVEDDIRNQADLVSCADVIIINNTFEYFCDKHVTEEGWKFLIKHVKPKALLVIAPRAEEIFANYEVGMPWSDWLEEIEPYDKQEAKEENYSEISDMGIYRAIQSIS